MNSEVWHILQVTHRRQLTFLCIRLAALCQEVEGSNCCNNLFYNSRLKFKIVADPNCRAV